MYAILVAGLLAAGKTRFAEREMLAGRDLLIENNFEEESLEPMRNLLEKYGCDAITVRFQGDIETIYSRFLDRERSPDRHPGHIRNDHYPADDPPSLTSPTLEQFAEGAGRRGFVRFSLGRLIEVDATDASQKLHRRRAAARPRVLLPRRVLLREDVAEVEVDDENVPKSAGIEQEQDAK